jgi:hypothetical protein
MTISIRDTGGALRNVTAVKARDGSGILRNIQKIAQRDAANILRTIWEAVGALAATPSPYTSFGAVASTGVSSVTTSDIIIVVTGGTPPYTFSGARIDANPGVWTLIGTGPKFGFRVQSVPANATRDAIYRFTVTDALGAVTVASDVAVTAENYGGLQ